MKGDRAVHVLIFDGFADWEPAHALAELRRWGKREVRTVAFTTVPVLTIGGLRVTPDVALAAVKPSDVEIFIMPGGDMWQEATYPRAELESLLASLVAAETPVAAICAATLALGRIGILDDRRHTSNMLKYLAQYAAGYAGADNYVDAPAVRDRHVITASGLSPVDFAREIFAELRMLSEQDERLWFDMFKHGRLPQA